MHRSTWIRKPRSLFTNARKARGAKSLAVAAAVMALVAGAAVPAHAASSNIGGNVNCTGSWVNYTTERATTNVPIETYLSNAAGSARGGWQTSIGIRIVANGALHTGVHPFADTWAHIANAGIYYQGTRFTMRAKMEASSGTCDNTWAATLYH